MMQRIEKLIIEICKFCMIQNVDSFILVKTSSIFHMVQNIEVLIAHDVQNEDNSIFYMM